MCVVKPMRCIHAALDEPCLTVRNKYTVTHGRRTPPGAVIVSPLPSYCDG